MKVKKIISLGLIGGLSIGSIIGVKAFADMSSSTIQQNTLMTRNLSVESEGKEGREIALDYIQRYLDEKVDVNSLYEKSEVFNVNGKKLNGITWSTTNDDNAENIRYTATIDAETNELKSIQYIPQKAENDNDKNFSYDEGKNLAAKFIEKNNILGTKDYKLVTEEPQSPSEQNTFIFEYDGGKKCVIVVDNNLKKITQVLLFDESEGLG